MALPASFAREGFNGPSNIRTRMRLRSGAFLKPIMIGLEGKTNSGKSEFMMSAPGPGICIVVDRGIDGCLDNPNPPATRQEDWAFKVISVPLNQMRLPDGSYVDYFKNVRETLYKALANPDAVSVAIDGDSDFWELQRLAEFGKLANVWPQTRYGDVYAAKRAMIARAWDSGKIVIATNKVRDEYEAVVGPDGQPVKEADGSEKKRKTGREVRQGFPDQDFLWSIQLRTMYRPAAYNEKLKRDMPQEWGVRILKCKAVPSLLGTELWGEDCNFQTLVQLVYPDVPLKEWGF